MLRKQILFLSLLVVLAGGSIFVWARPMMIPDYAYMTDKSDMVVIATPIGRKELPGDTSVPGVTTIHGPIPAVEVETTFRAVVVLRGTLTGKSQKFTLLHFKETNPPPGGFSNGPYLVDFTPDSGDQYLMFLKRNLDGRYETMNGQTDPAQAIEKLQQKLLNPTPPTTQK